MMSLIFLNPPPDLSSTTKNLFEKRFPDFQKLLIIYFLKVLGGVGTFLQKGSDKTDGESRIAAPVDITVLMMHNRSMKSKKRAKGILILKDHCEADEIDFELEYLLSLSVEERFHLMENKSREIKHLLEQNGHRRPSEIIKRQ